MAKKRMFNLSIVDSDAFLEMPLTTQALYFHLNMRADDDGFIGNPKRIARLIGSSEDDLKLLIAKRFVLTFEDGVIVIKHWRMHNTLSANRYTETVYIDDKNKLLLKDNKSYSFNSGKKINDSMQIETGKRQQTSNRRTLDEQKTNTDKDIDLDIDIVIDKELKEMSSNEDTKKQSEEWFNAFWTAYPNKANRKKSKERFLKICTSEKMFNTIMEGMQKTVISKAKAEGTQYIPMASTWLNGERWNDEPYKQPTPRNPYVHTTSMPDYMNEAQSEATTSQETIDEVQELLKGLHK